MTRLHPDDLKTLATMMAPLIVAELRRPVLVPGGVPVLSVSAADLEARLRSEGLAHRAKRRSAGR